MKSCPECSGKVPETYEECPFCGHRFDMFSESVSDDESAFWDEEKNKPEKESGGGLRKFFFEVLLFITALLVAGIIVLATDFKGARTELRRICMTDSGDGSERDSQQLRIRVKYYILVCLDFFDHGGTGASVRTNSNAFERKPLPEDSSKTETPGIQEPVKPLPPSPPKVEDFEFTSENNPAENSGKENVPESKEQVLP